MILTYTTLAIIIAIILIVATFIVKKAKTRKTLGVFAILVGLVGVAGLLGLYAPLNGTVALRGTTLAISPGVSGGTTTVSTYQPTATYSTVDKFSSIAITGTSYYKEGSSKATTTAISNTDPSKSYSYWVSNTTTFVKPYTFMGSGTNTITNDNAYRAGTVTINGYDLIGNQAISFTGHNASLSSGTAKIQFTVLGSATTSMLPFGGVLVASTNNTISQINCFGNGISSTPSTKYQLTYAPTFTSDRYVAYEIAPGYDVSPDGLVGVTKTFECDFVASTTPGFYSNYTIQIYPANYYYVNTDGSFALDTEKAGNGVTTRTAPGPANVTYTMHWNE